MADVAKLEAALLKAHNAGDTRAAQAIANEIKRVRSAAPAKSAAKPTMWQSFQAGMSQAPEAVLDWVIRQTTSPEYQKTHAQQRQNAMRDLMAPAREANPGSFLAGDVLTSSMMAAPVTAGVGGALVRGGGALATKAPKVAKAVQAVGRATKTGGLGSGRTAAQTAAMTRGARAADVATRVAGGAVAGATGAAATGQSPVEGAVLGGGLPLAAGGARKAAGVLTDLFKGDKIRAAQMFREALGDNLDAAKAAFAQLGPDDQRLARKVLIDEGIEPDTFMALGANVERLRPEQVRRIAEAETAAAREGLEAAAGVAPGASVTDTRAAVRGGRKAVSQAMTPVREEAFGKIKDVNRAVGDAEMLAQTARERATEQSGLARRMAFGSERAETRLGQADDLGDVFDPEAVGRLRGQAGAMGQRAETAAQEAIAQRGVAADMEDFIHQAAAADVKPQRAAPLVEGLRRMAAQEGTRMDDLQRNTILRVARKIEGAMDANGMVSPYDMYQLRKTGVSDIIEGFQKKITAGTEPRSGNVQRAEQLAGDVRGLIDNMLGPEFKDYLARSAEGYKFVNRQELAGEALKRFNEPGGEGFLKLARGDDPKAVAKIMKGGPDQENIGNALTAQMSVPFTEAAGLLNARNRMAELASSGSARAAELMSRETPRKFRAATRIALSTVPAGRIAVEGAEQLAGDFMRPKVREQLAQGFLSGQNANALLDTFPRSMLIDEQISKLSPYQRNLLAQSVRNYLMSSPDQNAMAGF